jgi:hypothetical protein
MKEGVKLVLEWERRWSEGEARLFRGAVPQVRDQPASRLRVARRYRDAERVVEASRSEGGGRTTVRPKVAEGIEELLVGARKLHPT